MNSRRTAANSRAPSPEDRAVSAKASSGEYALGTLHLDSPRTLEVGLSVCHLPAPQGEAGESGLGIRQELSAIADERGLLVLTDSLLPVGTRVALEIRLSAWTKLCVFGHVRSHGGAPDAPAMGVGIAFEDLPTAARCQLMAYLGVEQREAPPSDTPNG